MEQRVPDPQLLKKKTPQCPERIAVKKSPAAGLMTLKRVRVFKNIARLVSVLQAFVPVFAFIP